MYLWAASEMEDVQTKESDKSDVADKKEPSGKFLDRVFTNTPFAGWYLDNFSGYFWFVG